MKIAALSDIHANFSGLQAVVNDLENWKPDYVVVIGDIVNRGPRPAECLNFIIDKSYNAGWLLVRGNHEDYVISRGDPATPNTGPDADVHQPSTWTYEKISDNISVLKTMPVQASLISPDGGELRFVHGSMRGMRDGIYPETSDQSMETKIHPPGSPPPPPLLAVGHTHRPLVRSMNSTLVVNAGSSGLPFDGDRRISYAQLTWIRGVLEAKIIRLQYDIETAERDFFTSGYMEEAGPLIEVVLHEFKTASSHLYHWSSQYQAAALTGQISMRDAVDRYLAAIN